MKKFTLTVEVDDNGAFGLWFDGMADFHPAEVVGYLEYAKLDAIKQGFIEDERYEVK